MIGPFIFLFFTLAVYIPLSCVLFYVWWKHGKDEKGVMVARIVYIIGSIVLFSYMLYL